MAILNKHIAVTRELSKEEVTKVSGGMLPVGTMCDITTTSGGTTTHTREHDDAIE